MLLHKNDKLEWKQINYRSISTALGMEFLHDLYNQYLPEVNAIRFRNTITVCNGTEITSYAPKREWDLISTWFTKRFIRGDEELFSELRRYIDDPKQRLHEFREEYEKTTLRDMHDIDLALALIDFQYRVLNSIYRINLVQVEHAMWHAIDELAKEVFPAKKERNKAISCMVYSEEATVGVEEERDFLTIVRKGIMRGCKEPDTNIMTMLDQHCETYRYVHCAYGTEPYDLDHYISQYKEAYEQGLDRIVERGRDIEKGIQESVNRKRHYVRKIKERSTLRRIIGLYTEIGSLRDRNKALLGRTMRIRNDMLDEISARKRIPRYLLDHYFLAELCSLLKDDHRISEIDIRRRKNGMVLRREESFDIMTEDPLKGCHGSSSAWTCASPGSVDGTVRIIRSAGDISKMNKGDIMVAHGTDFDLIGAMQMAGGIITEEGGLLSHASVISRELKIPCLIGVEDATTRFSDGDTVRLDADNERIEKMEGCIHE